MLVRKVFCGGSATVRGKIGGKEPQLRDSATRNKTEPYQPPCA
jgi:hypothetical protein